MNHTPKQTNKTPNYEKALSVLNLEPGAPYRVLDFACGRGEFLGHLAQLVGDGAQLVGVDAKEQFIQQARTELPDIEFICDKFVDKFAFADSSFDIVVTLDVIECIEDKATLIDEIHRILAPGGTVLAVHWDWDSQIYAADNQALADKITRAYSEWQQPWMDTCDGRMGRKLWGLFEGSKKFRGRADVYCLIETGYETGQYGFDNMVSLSKLVEEGGLDRADHEQFHSELSRLNAEGRYFYSLNSFIYCGEKV